MKRRLRVTIPGYAPTPKKGWVNRGSDLYEYVFEGDIDFEVEELTTYVQVEVLGTSTVVRYTYEDSTGKLAVGDLVEVPFGIGNDTRIAKVVDLGRGRWAGPTKLVISKLQREVLA